MDKDLEGSDHYLIEKLQWNFPGVAEQNLEKYQLGYQIPF
jgi:hypothetical protein